MLTPFRGAVLGALGVAWSVIVVPAQAGENISATPPRVHDERLTLTCFAREPEVVTPTAVAVTADGAVVAIECHTHFRPRDYRGPVADRMRAYFDDDGDGVSDRAVTVHEGTEATMGLLLPPGGGLVVATRSEVFKLDDPNGDGLLDQRTPLVRLETKGNYPHNGLGGLAADPQGRLYLGMGENLGALYRLRGSDGRAWSGGGEGGNVFRVAADGSELERWATGFWNPFALTLTPAGHLFGVDNDPDSRPPCRLLDIVPGGDYGYRYRYGRKGLHPFNAWNGELPGTLPMVAGTGEAPSGIVWYTGRGLPAEYRDALLVTSWGDHRIERYRLQPWGASFRSSAEVIVSGGEDFRPVGLAVGPDGALYFSDWVDKAYEVHGRGRLWRLGPSPARRERESSSDARHSIPVWRAPSPESLAGPGQVDLAGERASGPAPVDARAASLLSAEQVSTAELRAVLGDGDPFVTSAARWRLAQRLDDRLLDELAASPIAAERWAALALARDRIEADDSAAARIRASWNRFLEDPDPRVRFSAIEQVAAHEWREFRPRLFAGLARASESGQLVEAQLAALDWLDRPERRWTHDVAGESYLVELLADDEAAPALVTYALRALPPDHPGLTAERLTAWLDSRDPTIALEATRTWRLSARPERAAQLLRLVGQRSRGARQRTEAVLGLSPSEPAERRALLAAAQEDVPAVRREAWRALRGTELTAAEQADLAPATAGVEVSLARQVLPSPGPAGAHSPARPPRHDLAAWQARLPRGDAAAGERVFFDPRGVGCFRCHRRSGRGASVGPDLSPVAEQANRERILQSLLEPSREVAPQFVTWNIATQDGRTLSGVLWQEEAAGRRTFVAASGEPFSLEPTEIESLRPSPVSVMPDNLVDSLSDSELADLLAYLGGGEE